MPRPMKDSGVEWLGEIPADWKLIQLKRFALVNNGKEIQTEIDKSEDAIPVYGSGGVFKYTNTFLYNGEAVMFGRKGTLGKPIYANEKFWTVDTMYYLTFSDELFAKFNYYQLIAFDWVPHITQTALPSIVGSEIVSCKFAVPPLDEQQRIATFLDGECARIDSVIEKTRASIVEYKKLKQAIITRAVTKGIRPARTMKDSGVEWLGEIPTDWNVTKIKHLGNYRNGLTYNPNDIVDKGQGTLILRSSNIQQGKLCFEDNVYVNADIPERLMVQKGDIIICSRNGSRELIGKCAIVENDMVASFGAFMMIFRGDSPKYMYYILNSDVFKYYLSTFLTSTINQLTGGNFGNMEIVWCADKVEQKEIVSYLDAKTAAIDLLVEKKNQLVTELERLKKSLIFEYVTGKKAVAQ